MNKFGGWFQLNTDKVGFLNFAYFIQLQFCFDIIGRIYDYLVFITKFVLLK